LHQRLPLLPARWTLEQSPDRTVRLGQATQTILRIRSGQQNRLWLRRFHFRLYSAKSGRKIASPIVYRESAKCRDANGHILVVSFGFAMST
jgi:hypothetical protein